MFTISRINANCLLTFPQNDMFLERNIGVISSKYQHRQSKLHITRHNAEFFHPFFLNVFALELGSILVSTLVTKVLNTKPQFDAKISFALDQTMVWAW